MLREALHHFDAAEVYARSEHADHGMVLDAMTMRLFAGLETLTRLPEQLTMAMFADRWPDMRALRHRIAHGYGAVNLERVRATVSEHVPQASSAIRRELGD